MQIKKRAEICDQTQYPDVKEDYVRTILNHTGEAVRITDSSGRTLVYEPIPRPLYTTAPELLTIEEWFRHTEIDSMVDVPNALSKDIVNWRVDQGVKLSHDITREDLAEMPNGVYLEEVNLHISMERFNCNPAHPRFTSAIREQIGTTTGTYIGIEIWDPRGRIDTLYANIAGTVYPIVPRRTPTPKEECVVIRLRDSTLNAFNAIHYSLDELLTGPGKHGIRLYRTEVDAAEDERRGDKAILTQARREVQGKRNEIREEGFEAGRRATLDEAAKIRATADEQLRKAEETLNAHRKSKRKDRTDVVLNLLKVLTAGMAVYKIYKAG